jgi:N-acetylneuraminic acid mutarotase
MVIWGGQTASTALNTGASYNPTSNAWTLVSTVGVPVARTQHTAVWTGDKMIIWGGAGGLNDGGQYDVATDTWRPTSLVAVPVGRQGHSAVWTRKEMIVFGGLGAGIAFNDTYTYPPTTFVYLYAKP